jgi:ethanolamine ammonia-lyase small subunit
MHPDAHEFLRAFTPARIAAGRSGHSLPTRALLAFNLDHARARDAVWSALDLPRLLDGLRALHPDVRLLHSQARDRQEYLLRPDRGRKLSEESARQLQTANPELQTDLSLVVADGLSAQAVNAHALPVAELLLRACREAGWSLAPICLVQQGRVAVADEIGALLGAQLTVILLGERPGLTSPDSLGAYLTYAPRPGLTDERRNCVSNIRPGVDASEGLGYEPAAKLFWLLSEMKNRRLSGVELKDEMPVGLLGKS